MRQGIIIDFSFLFLFLGFSLSACFYIIMIKSLFIYLIPCCQGHTEIIKITFEHSIHNNYTLQCCMLRCWQSSTICKTCNPHFSQKDTETSLVFSLGSLATSYRLIKFKLEPENQKTELAKLSYFMYEALLFFRFHQISNSMRSLQS